MAILICFFLAFLAPQKSLGQNGFAWDSWVGCANGEVERKYYFELIAEGLCHRVCNQSTVTYTITGVLTSQITNTVWHVVGGTVLSTPNNSQCIVQWGSTTTGAIGFTTTNIISNTAVTIPDLCVNLTINPIANFTIAPIDPTIRPPDTYTACVGQELFFENLSSANGGTEISSFYWDFRDGTTSSLQSPTHTFMQEGVYTVALKVDNQCSCSSTRVCIVEVRKKGVQIDCPSIVCEGQKATYNLPSSFALNCSQFNWSVIGGKILGDPPYSRSIEVLWEEQAQTNDFGYVTFDPVGCNVDCYKPSTLKIPIIKQKATIVGDENICGPAQVRYVLPQWPTTDFQWEVVNSNGTQATLTPTDQRNEVLLNTGTIAGTVVLKCNYTNTLLNCGGVAKPLTITIKLPADIYGENMTCVNNTETYTENSGASLSWQLKKLPSGTFINYIGVDFTHTFTVAGDYSLTASGPYLCNPISKIITVTNNATPIPADFLSPLTICPGSSRIYSYNNTAPGTVIRWQVTGGQILGSNSGNAVTIIFGLPPSTGANYSIKLWRENSNGPACSSTILTLFPVIPVPDTVIKGATLAGAVYVTAPAITNPCGSSFATYKVDATDMDNYEWEISPAFAGNISVPDATKPWIISVLWNQFANQSATLRLKTKKCLQPVVSNLAVIISSPTITLVPSVTSICRNQPITFTLSGNPTGNIVWDFGNGVTEPSNVPFITYTYSTVSTANINYAVKATITNPNGCVSVVTTTPVNIQVKVAPVALITPANNVTAVSLAALLAAPVASRTLTATITTGYGATLLPIKWYKNNVLIIPQPAVSTSYVVTSFGDYYAEVFNTALCATKTNTVRFFQFVPDTTPACPASFDPTLTLSNACGVVTATVTNSGSTSTTIWSSSFVGSPNPATATSATFTTTSAGQYNVTYRATYNNAGTTCAVSKTATITVPYIPDVRYAVSCVTGANYVVKLYNNSNVYPSTLPNIVAYSIKNLATNITTNYTAAQVAAGIPLSPGNYQAIISLTRTIAPAYPMCSKIVPFTLGAKPTVAFTMSSSSTCPGTPISLTLVGPVNPNYTYFWSFEPLASNTKPNNLFVTYTTGGAKTVSLTVTDKNGCTSTTSQPINVLTAQQLIIDPESSTSAVKCQGTPAILLFTPPSGTTPVSYKWMLDNAPVVGGTTNTLTTYTSGNYWLQTANASGCFRPVTGYSVSVSFVDIPLPQIISMNQVCLANGIPLSSTVGNDPFFQYLWKRDGVVINYTAGFTDYPDNAGNYTYTLEVKAPLGDGTFCSKISNSFVVNVIDSPLITNISFQNILNPVTGTCNPFKISLSATANAIGTFTWSNGMNGATINETAGGAYQVLFTTPSGCTTTAQIYVPRDLSSYFWIVPKGCYTFCAKYPTQQVIGPAIKEFPSWAWLLNSLAAPAGTLAVTAKDINAPGTYQLQLGQGRCAFKSDPFSISYQSCDQNANCNNLSATISSVNLITTPYLNYAISLNIGNTSGSSFIATINTTNARGFFIPATVTVMPGGGIYTVYLLPNSVLTGAAIEVFVTTTDRNGNLCQQIINVNIPGTINPSRKIAQQVAETATSLQVYPNPAADIVTIQYDFTTTVGTTQLQVYDTTAQLIATYNPTASRGIWDLPIDSFAAGMYIVVLKQEDVVIAQKSLLKK